MLVLPPDYLERVYAGVLGKLIGVYLGRPFEMWSHQRIMSELGVIKYYVNDRLNVPIVVTDDDVSGTFVFVRALDEHGIDANITSEAIGKTWLNTAVENKSIFWWGGRGISTEHTAYWNLKNGVSAPDSGSIATNGVTVAEQIGAQIFIDGWALVSPGRPGLAAKMAGSAGRVSHDGESVNAAILWAAMEAEAFLSKDIDHLIDTGLRFIPCDSLITQVVSEVRAWVKADGDWYKTREKIEAKYGYDKFEGTCHVIPNHCIMHMAILYGGHSFSKAMEIINTSGWDTDCNSGNVGCLMGIIHGIDSLSGEGYDWRGPIADRAIISSSLNGYSINNAARIALDLTNFGRRLADKAPIPQPKNSQFHFTLPGSVQGFQVSEGSNAKVSQAVDRNDGPGLLIEFESYAKPVEVLTHTATPLEYLKMPAHYPLMSSPLVYTGQKVTASIRSGKLSGPVEVRLRLKAFNSDDELVPIDSDAFVVLVPGDSRLHQLEWVLPEIVGSYPIGELGVVITSGDGRAGQVWLDRLAWHGEPNLTVKRPATKALGKPNRFWDYQWVQGVDHWMPFSKSTIFIGQDRGEGIASYGTRDWANYRVTVKDVSVKIGGPCGVAVRVQGLRRYYALLFVPKGWVALVKVLDNQRIELARAEFNWTVDEKYEVTLEAVGPSIKGSVGGVRLEAQDSQLADGALGVVATDGAMSTGSIRVQPVE
ncbi:ADP-ribosylation/Crystallin J1 [Naematelia encephala]|uniref:ADP-ribosylation/Crystallin J1 n=1 Tax=Naematelia encephala TaxID=71784 RepID=A0A1Y2B298_9TREE|nr:ADP-ribosylation/Crystallin J1 [Naematelia encephala]